MTTTITPSFDLDYDRLRNDLAPMARRFANNKQDSEDLLQETMLKVFLHLDQYDRNKSLKNWALRIMYRTWLDIVRTRNRRVSTVSYDQPLADTDELQVEFKDESVDIERALVAEMSYKELADFLVDLAPQAGKALVMAEGEDMTYDEIADVTGIRVGTVRSRVHRAKRIARTALTSRGLRNRFGIAA